MPFDQATPPASAFRTIFFAAASVLILVLNGANAQDQPALAIPPASLDLAGIEAIAAPGAPGPIAVFGERAFPLVTPNPSQAVVAGAAWGEGRVAVLGHGGMLGANQHDHARLLARLARWCAPTNGTIAITSPSGRAIEALKSEGIEMDVGEDDWRVSLEHADLLILDTHQLTTDQDRALVRGFVINGGGWITSGLAWGWLQLNPGQTIHDHPGNLILPEAGLAFADGIVSEDPGDRYRIDGPPSPWAHAGGALAALESGDVQPDQRAAAGATIASLLRTLPADANPVRDRLSALVRGSDFSERYRAMHADGLSWKNDALARLGIELFLLESFDDPTSQVVKHPSADGFPGAVPASADRSVRTVEVNTSLPGWRCTGLYAPPGEMVTLVFTDLPMGAAVQIGAHLDPESRGDLNRLPRVVRRFDVTANEIDIANPVGGLIYLDIPAGFGAPSVTLSARGAVQAPHFVRGITTNEAWQTLRAAPGPWAELESDEIALTVPSSVVRDLDDPEALMAFWDDVTRAQGALQPRRSTGMPDRQARFVPDVSVSWGYMYAPANRPLTVPTHTAKNMVDLGVLRAQEGGNVWGFFHELGHWHQDSMWTFAGTGEVTVNLFTLYALDLVCGLPPAEARGFTSEKLLDQMRAHREAGAPFDVWKRKPFLALAMYVQLQQAFGWALYEDVFAEYRTLEANDRPKSDDDKRDQWLVRLSRTSGHDLGGFFDAWGVPTSEQARESISDLPPWMPEGW